MSKRLSGKQTNTLLNYFQSPQNAKSKELQSNDSLSPPKKPALTIKKAPEILFTNKPRSSDNSSSDDEGPAITKAKKKRIRAVIDSSDSDNDTPKEPKRAKAEKENRLKEFAFASDVVNSPKRDVKSASNKKTTESNVKDYRWFHETLDFLQPDKIQDAQHRIKDHPDYDPRTLYVPSNFFDKQTPGMRQWWTLKSKHADSILFFKMGKFYELYHMDAIIGFRYLGLSYMKGEFAHSGFPEIAYNKMASTLIDAGFKVARIEQTETPEMLAERCKKQSGKKDKVVCREICQISSLGTCVYGQQMTTPSSTRANYILAVADQCLPSGKNRYGVVFVDTSIGLFHLADFDDDKQSSRLLALLAQHPPLMVLTERGRITPQTLALLEKNTSHIKFENLTPDKQFYSAEKTIRLLQEAFYFKNTANDTFKWPQLFTDELLDHGAPTARYTLALKSLGAVLWYLRYCEIDLQVFSMSQFTIYNPLDVLHADINRESMILDSFSIDSLQLIGSSGSLQQTLDYCRTAFGKRLLTLWICRPLADVQKIKCRQEAIKELVDNPFVLRDARELLGKIPDLERQIMKINTFGNKYYSKTHPDSRAIFYELKIYMKRKIHDLLITLNGFKDAMGVIHMFRNCTSRYLVKLTQIEPNGSFVDVSKTLQHFNNLFDADEAIAKGQIFPKPGQDDNYDNALSNIAAVQRELDAYLKKQRQLFGCNVAYFGTDKKRYQIEIGENKCGNVPADYRLEGCRKGTKPMRRYTTSETRDLLAHMIKAEQERDAVIADLNRRIFEQFSSYYPQWERVTQSLTVLDVLCSLADYTANSSRDMCLPTVLPFADEPFVRIEDGCHPCMRLDNYVSNSIELGIDGGSNVLLLTGPNMGGKSTLMRQMALIVIMAQIGCYVPATVCTLTAVDRVFTRIGANDNLFRGESTFLTEMLESSCILHHATRHSLLLVDELGRGTSTHDGTAIATAYVHALCKTQSRTIFSTHYHNLVEYFNGTDGIQLGHMACVVDQEDNTETVTFLYKLTKGQCPKSYGFNVAALAGLPDAIVAHAQEKAAEMEATARCRAFVTQLGIKQSIADKKQLILGLQRLQLK